MKSIKEQQTAFMDGVSMALDMLKEAEKEHLINSTDSYQQKVTKEHVLGVLRRYGEAVRAAAEAALREMVEEPASEEEPTQKPMKKTAKAAAK